ncbi:ER membrane protein complex subunit 10 [Mortierella antarctica]|nr:ER membrane protein complex subunit 10 [Mortierella antarctica]
MRLSAYILGFALAASVQVLAEEVTLGVYHKLSDHESFEKRGEIRFDTEEWVQYQEQQAEQRLLQQQQANTKRQYKKKNKNMDLKPAPQIVYSNIELGAKQAQSLVEDFVLNVKAPYRASDHNEEPTEAYEDETEEEFATRVEEWKMQEEEATEKDAERTPGTVGFYQIKLMDETRGWEAMSSIKSCLLVASDFQERFTLHLDQNRNVFAFDYYTSVDQCADVHSQELPLSTLDKFKNTQVELLEGNQGPKARYNKAQAIKLDETTGQPAVEKTFFQKYWMYILPAVIMFLFAGGEPEKPAA